jgi:hypothetical protein
VSGGKSNPSLEGFEPAPPFCGSAGGSGGSTVYPSVCVCVWGGGVCMTLWVSSTKFLSIWRQSLCFMWLFLVVRCVLVLSLCHNTHDIVGHRLATKVFIG